MQVAGGICPHANVARIDAGEVDDIRSARAVVVDRAAAKPRIEAVGVVARAAHNDVAISGAVQIIAAIVAGESQSPRQVPCRVAGIIERNLLQVTADGGLISAAAGGGGGDRDAMRSICRVLKMQAAVAVCPHADMARVYTGKFKAVAPGMIGRTVRVSAEA